MSIQTFGIIGAGNIGKALAKHLTKAGYEVLLSNSRGGNSLDAVAAELGKNARIGTTQQAAKQDVVILSLPWAQLPVTLPGLGDWKDKIVVDATNHFISFSPEMKVEDLGDLTSSEVVSDLMPGAKLVKAFNTLPFKILGSDPHEGGGKRVIFLSGDDQDAKNQLKDAIGKMGFAPIDLGTLAAGGKMQQAMGPLASHNLLKLS